MDTKQKIQSFYKKLDSADGEEEINPIMQNLQNYISTLTKEEKQWAEQDFKYYITKRIQKSEERIQKIEQEIKTENSIL